MRPQSEDSENSDTTSPLTPPSAKKIVGEEKPASLTAKAAAIAGSIKGLMGSLTAKAAADKHKHKAATDIPVMPPNTQKNDGGEKHTGDTCEKHKNKPGIPDPNAKAAEIASAAAGAAVPKDTTEQKAPAVKDDNKGPIPDSKENANAKAATMNLDEFDAAYHLKLAQVILETEEGRQYAQNAMEKAYGAEGGVRNFRWEQLGKSAFHFRAPLTLTLLARAGLLPLGIARGGVRHQQPTTARRTTSPPTLGLCASRTGDGCRHGARSVGQVRQAR